MSDPGRITSNPHKASQWRARYWCLATGHQWSKGRCGRCGQGDRTVKLTITADTSGFTEALRRVTGRMDEVSAANRRMEPHEQIVYPLLDLRLRRDDCMRIIADEGLPVPGKSSCFFCPFHRETAWLEMARSEPDLFEKSCRLEDTLNARRDALGKDHVFLTRFGKPLRQIINDDQPALPADPAEGSCDSGWCFL